MTALPYPNRAAQISGHLDAMDATGRMDAWLTMGEAPVVVLQPDGPLYRVELSWHGGIVTLWCLGEPRPLMELADGCRRAAAQQVLLIDPWWPGYRWEGNDGSSDSA